MGRHSGAGVGHGNEDVAAGADRRVHQDIVGVDLATEPLQAGTSKQTGAAMEDKASQVLSSTKYSTATKQLAGSVLSQSNKKR
ncbi:UNVERIFIED_ORG: hypothetical protein BTE55_16580 [Rhizobium sophorae]